MVKEKSFQLLVLGQLNNQIQTNEVGGMSIMNCVNRLNPKCLRNATWSRSIRNISSALLDLFCNTFFHTFSFVLIRMIGLIIFHSQPVLVWLYN